MARSQNSFTAILAVCLVCADAARLPADDTVVLMDGREIVGKVGMLTSMAESKDKLPADDAIRPIVFVDDNLRRISFPKVQIREVKNGGAPNHEVIVLKQPVCQAGNRIASVGPILRVDNFDQFGRRIFSMKADTKDGKIDIIQGITDVHPVWTRVQSLMRQGGGPQYIWDTRIATSSIPRETLSKLLANQIGRKDVDGRLKVVRLYLGSERYTDAQAELASLINDFPDLANLKEEQKAIRQLGARRALDEIALRQKAGQHRLAQLLLTRFPTQDVAGAVLQEVKARQDEYKTQLDQIEQTKKQLAELAGKIEDSALRTQVAPLAAEVIAELNLATINRMTTFRQFLDSPSHSHAQKTAFAVSGWLLGANDATDNLPLSLSLYNVRQIIRRYMVEPIELKRSQMLGKVASEEAGSPRYVARLLARMKPPVDTPPQTQPDSGAYALTVQGLPGEAAVNYLVQLPPEYDPYRNYPAVVTLNGSGTTPTQQINWWSGEPNASGIRLGQATRHGYITIAPDWTKKGQVVYQYDAREHAAILSVLRDACRRFSVDTNRVYLSGHSIGGDAAWDIGIAHPDIWAGIVPITASADRYIAHYAANARYVPLYLVSGELDGDRMVKNARDIDRYMFNTSKPHHNVTVVEYLGRGHEHFYDEIQDIFGWMNKQERNFFPTEFKTTSMRAWDNFFWWVELDDLPDFAAMKSPKPITTQAKLTASKDGNQTLSITSGAGAMTVWLAPEMVDFNRRIKIAVKGQTVFGEQPSPQAKVILEDARTRGDRQHPFWAKVDIRGASVHVEKPKRATPTSGTKR